MPEKAKQKMKTKNSNIICQYCEQEFDSNHEDEKHKKIYVKVLNKF